MECVEAEYDVISFGCCDFLFYIENVEWRCHTCCTPYIVNVSVFCTVFCVFKIGQSGIFYSKCDSVEKIYSIGKSEKKIIVLKSN